MKILICLVTRMTNRGVDALVASKAAALAKTFPGAEIDVLTEESELNRPFLDARGIGIVHNALSGWRLQLREQSSTLRPLVERLARRHLAPLAETEKALRGYSLGIVTGGDNLSSDYGSPGRYLAPVHVMQDAGIPVAILGQSIGPFRDPEHARAFLSVARRSPLVTVRESASLKYVTEELGLPQSKVHLTADTAFLLEPAEPELARKMMRSFGLDLERPVIALSVSGGIAGFASASAERHLAALERLARRLLAETGAQILLVPHVEDWVPSNNDLIVADRLLRMLDFDPRVRLAKGFLLSNEFKAIVAQCAMVVAERMHVAIAGLSSGVATFVIGYSVKGHGIMSDCFGVDSRAEGLVTPLETFLADPAADEQVLKVWREREGLAARLAARLPQVKALAARNFELLPPLLVRAAA